MVDGQSEIHLNGLPCIRPKESPANILEALNFPSKAHLTYVLRTRTSFQDGCAISSYGEAMTSWGGPKLAPQAAAIE